jgi:hypothetical protein
MRKEIRLIKFVGGVRSLEQTFEQTFEQTRSAPCLTIQQHEEHKAAFWYLKTHTFVREVKVGHQPRSDVASPAGLAMVILN